MSKKNKGPDPIEPLKQMCSVLVAFNKSNRCPFCKRNLAETTTTVDVVAYIGNKPHHGVKFEANYCRRCGVPVAYYKDIDIIAKKISPYKIHIIPADKFMSPYMALHACYVLPSDIIEGKVHKTHKTKNKFRFDPDTWSDEPLNLSKRCETLFIYSAKCTCQKCYNKFHQDTIKNRKAMVLTCSGKTVTINTQFCIACGQFFMNIESLRGYEKVYGKLDVSLEFDDDILDDKDEVDFADDSILSRHGYSVRAGIPRTERQRVLSYILNDGIATKHEIIKLLTQFIKINRHRFPDACRRWEEDILFVNQYRIDEQDNGGLLQMKQDGKIRRPDD